MLETVELPPEEAGEPPDRIARLLRAAERRVRDFLDTHRSLPLLGFVPCDTERVYRALCSVREVAPAAERFCEWGSGFGVVTALAAALGFEATGIEIRSPLVAESRCLLEASRLEAEILEGSFIPDDYEAPAEVEPDDWVTIRSGAGGVDEVDVGIDDFDLVFAYPWPGEEAFYFDLFDHRASDGALILTYHGADEGVLLQRKCPDRRD